MTVWSIITIPDAMKSLLSLLFSGKFRSSLFCAGLFLMSAFVVSPVLGVSGFEGGDGSRESPYLISGPEGLAALGVDELGLERLDREILTRPTGTSTSS